MTDCKKPRLAFWVTVLTVTLVFYALSAGPACWLRERNLLSDSAIDVIYWPIIKGPTPIYDAVV